MASSLCKFKFDLTSSNFLDNSVVFSELIILHVPTVVPLFSQLLVINIDIKYSTI